MLQQKKIKKKFNIKRFFPILSLSVFLHFILFFIFALTLPTKKPIHRDETVIFDSTPVEIEDNEKFIEPDPIKEVKPLVVPVVLNNGSGDDDKENNPIIEPDNIDNSLPPEGDTESTESFFEPSKINPTITGLDAPVLNSFQASGPPIKSMEHRINLKEKMLYKFNGDKKTLRAVEKGLAWLAHHQEKDGSWNPENHQGENGKHYSASITALSLLAFLGNGESSVSGKYKKNVSKGFRYLFRIMKKKKKAHDANQYGTALLLMAFSEALLFQNNSSYRKEANRLAKYLVDCYRGKGWGYHTSGTDFSVSGWVAMALKSAKMAEVPVMQTKKANDVLKQYSKWVNEYAINHSNGTAFYKADTHFKQRKKNQTGTKNMTWVAMLQKYMLTNIVEKDEFLTRADERTITWVKNKSIVGGDKSTDIYGLYYGTLAAFQSGGKVWNSWNKAMKPTLVNSQCEGDINLKGGSWDPDPSHLGQKGGRIAVTAIHILCLEVYFRYQKVLT